MRTTVKGSVVLPVVAIEFEDVPQAVAEYRIGQGRRNEFHNASILTTKTGTHFRNPQGHGTAGRITKLKEFKSNER
jgi:hypothetical protein